MGVTLAEAWVICRELDAMDAALAAAMEARARAQVLSAPTRPTRNGDNGIYDLCGDVHLEPGAGEVRCRRKDGHDDGEPHRWWDSASPPRIVEW